MDFEVLLVDNASSDGTVEHVRTTHPWVSIIPSATNSGFASANNLALRRARGDYVLLLNPDTAVPPHGLRDAVEELEARPDVGVLGCKLVRPDGRFDHACKRGFPTPLNALAYFLHVGRWPVIGSRLIRTSRSYVAASLGENDEGYVDAINGAFMLVRRAALEAVGPLDERFWMYAEDLDWCVRFWAAGWPVYYWPTVTVLHIKSGSAGEARSWRANRAFHDCMWLFYRKHQSRGRMSPFDVFVFFGIWLRLVSSASASLARRSRGGLSSFESARRLESARDS
jgi:GT2 family glycosyltransferase